MDQLIKRLDFLQTTSEKTNQYLSGKELSTIQFFCSGLLKRIDDTTTSTKTLFELLPKNNKYEFTIGIMFRALILDTLISMNLFKLIDELKKGKNSAEEAEAKVEEFCNTFLSDGLSNTLSYIQDAETFGMKSPEDTARTFKNMGNVFKPFFDNYPNDGTKPKLKFTKKHTAKQLFEILAKTENLKEISKIYDTYSYLSKYDHFGIIYYNAIHEKLETKLGIYDNISKTFVAHIGLIHVILERHSNNDSFLKSQLKLTNAYLLDIINNQKTANIGFVQAGLKC